jgi:hypothetical protein
MTQVIDAIVALTGGDLTALNSLVQPPEERLIILAQGKEFRNGDLAMPWNMPEVLKLPGSDRANLDYRTESGQTFKMGLTNPSLKKLPPIPLQPGPKGTFQFFNAKQGVRYTIQVINRKDQFVKALLTPGAHVVYSGHARFGRGPCFGSGGGGPGEMWEEGTTSGHPNSDGIFRMGFPFLAVDLEDVLHHGYTANLASADIKLAAADCDPDLRANLAVLKGRTLAELNPELVKHVRDADPSKKWWSYGSAKKRQLVMVAGWENTLSAPDDIGAITPTCRVFVHGGCSTFKHNHPVVRKLKAWKHDGDERYAYWTTDLSDLLTDHYWLQFLLTYDKPNAFQPLEKSLEFAKQKTNTALRNDNAGYQFI